MALKTSRFYGAAGLLTIVLSVLVSAPALARNFHVSGGIQYVLQGGKERAKGNEDDARRIFGKAVRELGIGISEDANDLEAWDYLGVAYAELDSAEKAGEAFNKGIAMAQTRPEQKKLLQRMLDNREHYWVKYFNLAIGQYRKAAEASSSGEPDSASAVAAADAMRRAVAMNPENGKSYCNLAAFLANARRYDDAMQAVDEGLTHAPGDTCLSDRKEQLSMAVADRAAESGDWEKAAAPFERALAKDPQNAAAGLRLGEIYFKQGRALEDDAGKLPEGADKRAAMAKARAAYERSADGFGKFVAAKPEDKDGRYNYTLSLVLAEKYQEAGKSAIAGLAMAPDSPDFHALLSNAYRGMKIEDPANGHTLVARILRDGAKAENPAATAQKNATKYPAGDVARILKQLGPPDEVRTQQMGDFPVEGWFWWGPKRAVLFSQGHAVSDVSFAQLVAAPQATPKSPARKTGARGTGRTKG